MIKYIFIAKTHFMRLGAKEVLMLKYQHEYLNKRIVLIFFILNGIRISKYLLQKELILKYSKPNYLILEPLSIRIRIPVTSD